jgi:hypothetical protein
MALIGLILGLLAMGCAPNLVSYPPTAIDMEIIKGIEEIKLPPYVPNGHYKAAIENALKQLRNAIAVYQEKLFPIFNQMHQKYQKKDYDGMDGLIAKAKAGNAEWFTAYLAFKTANENLARANGQINNSVINNKTGQIVGAQSKLIRETLSTLNTLRQLLDITEGYNKARQEWNLSFMTKENEDKFNQLSRDANEAGNRLYNDGKTLPMLYIELKDLLAIQELR